MKNQYNISNFFAIFARFWSSKTQNQASGTYGPNTGHSKSGTYIPLKANSWRTGQIWALFFCLIILNSCAPSRKWCEKAYGPCGVLEFRTDTLYKMTPVYIKGQTLIDTTVLYKFINDTINVFTPVVVTDSANYLQMTYWRDKYGRLLAKCEALPGKREAPCPEFIRQKVPPPEIISVIPVWVWVVFGLGGALILLLALKR